MLKKWITSATATVSPRNEPAGLEDLPDLGPEVGVQELWSPPKKVQRKTVDQLLLERGQITGDQLDQALQVQAKMPGKPIAQVLLSMNAASEAQILSALAETLDLPFQSPLKDPTTKEAFGLLSLEYIKKYQIVPLRCEEDILIVGMVDPSNVFILDEVKRRTQKLPKVYVITSADLAKVIEQHSDGTGDVQVDEIIKDVAEDDVQLIQQQSDDISDLEKMGNESPIIRFVNYVIHDAVKQGASDIQKKN